MYIYLTSKYYYTAREKLDNSDSMLTRWAKPWILNKYNEQVEN